MGKQKACAPSINQTSRRCHDWKINKVRHANVIKLMILRVRVNNIIYTMSMSLPASTKKPASWLPLLPNGWFLCDITGNFRVSYAKSTYKEGTVMQLCQIETSTKMDEISWEK